jgi:hypothetical protein
MEMEEVEQTLMFAQGEEEKEHSGELLKIFSQEAEQEVTAVLEAAESEEEEPDNIDFVDLCTELEALEGRVMVQSLHIQQVKLEMDGRIFQSEEQLEEARNMPVQGELAEANLSRREAEQRLGEETAKFKFAAGW